MKLPQRRLGEWSSELIDECYVSREQRRAQAKMWMSYYYTGTADGIQSRYNRCYAHVDRLASYLFSPSDVRMSIEFDEAEPAEVHAQAKAAGRKLNREMQRCDVDVAIAQSLSFSLVKGAMLVKTLWGHDGLEPWLVHPEFFGVLREDINDLDRQEAFVHSTYLTKSQFDRMLTEHPERDALMRKIEDHRFEAQKQDDMEESFLHQVIIGGTQPVSSSGSSTGRGVVGVNTIPTPMLDRKVAADLIRLDELWVLDDERQDWTTIRMVQPDMVIEGRYKRRNLCDAPGEQPFRKICANEVDGYFWGGSEIAQIFKLQDLLTDQIRDITRLTRLKSAPPRVLIGFSGMTQEKYKMLNRPNGFLSEDSPTGKVETLAPEIPAELFEAVKSTVNYFDDVAGFMPIMQGVGEPGVRAGVHAQTLARNASPRMRDRALLIEKQAAEVGDLCLKMLQAKNAKVLITDKKDEFMLAQLPDGARVTIDSHTSSPAFQEDAERKAFQLARFGAIDSPDLIMLTHPPHEDSLIMRAKQRAEAEAELVKQHPELLTKKKGGRK